VLTLGTISGTDNSLLRSPQLSSKTSLKTLNLEKVTWQVVFTRVKDLSMQSTLVSLTRRLN
jgi:hypothetical protein